MKKSVKKLLLSKETVWSLEATDLPEVVGASFSNCSCSGPVVCGPTQPTVP